MRHHSASLGALDVAPVMDTGSATRLPVSRNDVCGSSGVGAANSGPTLLQPASASATAVVDRMIVGIFIIQCPPPPPPVAFLADMRKQNGTTQKARMEK